MTTQALPRVFKLGLANETLTVDDPNPDLTPEEVKAHFAALYPQIASGVISPPEIEEDKLVYSISGKTVGVKG